MFPLAIFLLLCAAANAQPSDQTISLNCGGGASKSTDGRAWQPDSPSNFLSSNSTAAAATQQDPSISSDGPFMTARISTSKLSYAFPLSPGPKFLRLFFYPTVYSSSPSTFDASDSFFSVAANNFTLLRNFSASLHLLDPIPKLRGASLIKEFVVTVLQNQTLELSFTPSPSSLVFINGIEIAPIPKNLYIKDKDSSYAQTRFAFDNSTALETIFRLNVGGGGGSSTGDQTAGMFRVWEDDTDYMYGFQGYVHEDRDTAIKYTETTPSYTAPEIVYQTARSMGNNSLFNRENNLTWVFPVDSGFNYLVRLHFCETEKFINASNQRVFSIFLNNATAISEFDPFHFAGGSHVPIYSDYIVGLMPQGSERKHDLRLDLHPVPDAIFADVILNGVEIFKLNNSDGSLSGLNPEPPATPQQNPEPSKHNDKSVVFPVVGAAVGAALILSLVVFFVAYRRKARQETAGIPHKSKSKSDSSYADTSSLLVLPTDLCHRFSMPEIRAATRNFDEESVLGSGGFGTVYKGFIGSDPVAVKRLDALSKQGTREFHTEIQMLSKLRHAHLVSLIGYCDEEGEMVLVYEYMECGNLQDHLYKAKQISLPWESRLGICIGAARGLHYLHTGGKHAIIHRDVKSSNILLDGNWVAKVSDFGLSKIGPTSESQTHVSTFVRGSFGYLDPEYYRRQQLTEKSDVFSFGVVLLEVVFARPPIVPTQTKEKVNLVQWASKCSKSGTIYQNIDPELTSGVQAASLNKFIEIAESCVRDKATERPTMSDVLWALEFCLKLQETTGENVSFGDANKEESQILAYREVIDKDDEYMLTSSSDPILTSTATRSTESFSTNNSVGVATENVFSEIFNPNGR